MADESRIEQFQKAVEQDPNDALAQFGLGNALLTAGRADEAGPCFQRVLAIDSKNSKAYELLGKAQKLTGHTDLAIKTLTDGYRVAHRQGDVMTQKVMEKMLGQLGAEAPAVAAKPQATGADSESETGSGDFSCRRCGGGGPKIEKQPFKGELGKVVFDTVCVTCWREWVARGTMVINELRLPMYDPQAQATYDQQMKEFLLIDD